MNYDITPHIEEDIIKEAKTLFPNISDKEFRDLLVENSSISESKMEFLSLCLIFKDILSVKLKFKIIKMLVYCSIIEGIMYKKYKRKKPEARFKSFFIEYISLGNKLELIRGYERISPDGSSSHPICYRSSCNKGAPWGCKHQDCRLKNNDTELNCSINGVSDFIYDYYRCGFAHQAEPRSFIDDGERNSICVIDRYEKTGKGIKLSFSLVFFEELLKEGLLNFLKGI